MSVPDAGAAAFAALTRRELLRFIRQPSRIAAAIGTPLLLWAAFGAGFAGSFLGPEGREGSYAAYLLPGAISLTVMFSSIFAAISMIEDRHAGFLQSVLVSPAPRWAVVGSKVAGGTIVAAGQGGLLLLVAPLVGLNASPLGLVLALAALAIIAVGINGLGLAAAWRIDSVQGFHGVMNLVLMPMWLLSGAIFPAAGAAPWIRALMYVNPLYWPTAALRHALAPSPTPEPLSMLWIWAIALAAGATGFALAWLVVGQRRFRGGAS